MCIVADWQLTSQHRKYGKIQTYFKVVKYKDGMLCPPVVGVGQYFPGINTSNRSWNNWWQELCDRWSFKDDCYIWNGIFVWLSWEDARKYMGGRPGEAVIEVKAHPNDLIAISQEGDVAVFHKINISKYQYDETLTKLIKKDNELNTQS